MEKVDAKDYLKKEVVVKTDRQLGTKHPKHGFIYESNYGYIPNTVSGDATVLNKVINDAYSSFKEDTRYPIVVIKINTDPTLIDVNIHPSKQDIKFSNFEDLKELINVAIVDTIKTKLLIPKIEIKEEKKEVKYENISLDLDRNIVSDLSSIKLENKSRLTDIINFNYEPNNELDKEEDIDNTNIEIDRAYVEEITEKEKLPELYPVGLALGTYIICENEKGIYLIDQHAAEERVNYEKNYYLLSHPNNDVISPLVSIVIEFPLNEFLKIKD